MFLLSLAALLSASACVRSGFQQNGTYLLNIDPSGDIDLLPGEGQALVVQGDKMHSTPFEILAR